MREDSIKEVNWQRCIGIAVLLWLILYVGTWFIGGIIFWLMR